MRYHDHSGKRQIAAGIISIVMLAAVLFSAFYLIAEAEHECSGHDCPVCACMQQCERTLHQIGAGMTAQSAVIIPVVVFLMSVFLPAGLFRQATPVSEKVRLND